MGANEAGGSSEAYNVEVLILPYRSPSTTVRGLTVICLLIGSLFTDIPQSLAGASTFSATPSEVSAEAVLGGTTTVDIAISTGNNTTIQIYEANPPLARTQTAAPPARTPLPQQAAKIDPLLLEEARINADQPLQLLVFMAERADLSPAYQIADWAARGRYVYETLYRHAEQSQAELRAELDAAGLRYRPLWIVNALQVEDADSADLHRLATRADVALLRANHSYALAQTSEPSPDDLATCDPDASGVCWPLRVLNIPPAWSDFGTRGAGVVVANIDTGVLFKHTALAEQYRGYRSTGSPDHNYNWYDPDGDLREPGDTNGHGTHTMGTMVGRGDGSAQQPIFGVAPDAHWIAAQGCDGKSCDDSDLIASAQWLLAPTDLNGANPRPDLRPQIINNSWGDGMRQSNDWYAGYTTAWRAAGIFPVFAAGNKSQADCGSVVTPGEYDHVLTVGATTRDGTIAEFSARGPAPNDLLKPDVSAPGQSIFSTYRGAGNLPTTEILSGTSMATPHVTGLGALLYSANPELIGDYDALYALLTGTARRVVNQQSGSCGSSSNGANNLYGYGIVDAYAALSALDIPWLSVSSSTPEIVAGKAMVQLTLDGRRVAGPGVYTARILINDGEASQTPTIIPVSFTVTAAAGQQQLTGTIRDSERDTLIESTIDVRYADNTQGPSLRHSGSYRLQLPPGSYTLTASAPGYLAKSSSITIADAPLEQLFSLRADLPRLSLSPAEERSELAFLQETQPTITLTNTGTQPLSYTLNVSVDAYGVTRRTAAPGEPSGWISLPDDAPDLATELKNDSAITKPIDMGFFFPYYDRAFTGTYVAENGMLTFFQPPRQLKLQRYCLPAEEQFFFLVMPFKADLDFNNGGQMRHGPTPDQRGYVFSYEDVPIAGGEERYSFQVVFMRDGTMLFQYRDITPLPDLVGAGIQRSLTGYQSIACGSLAAISDGLTVELRPQPAQSRWISLPQPNGTIPPESSAVVPLQVRWVHPVDDEPYYGLVMLTTNDPARISSEIPLIVQTRPAAHELRLGLLFRR